MWRDLLRRLRRPRRQVGPARPDETDPWASVGRTPRPTSDVLAQIEQAALDIYAAHGLPTRPGHYRRGRRARSWSFLGADLTPEARWTALLERPPEDGWRYGTLPDLGRTGPPEVRAAGALLATCAHLKAGLAGDRVSDPLGDLELAVRLGADWRALESGRLRPGTSRLRLTAPEADATPAVAVKAPRRLAGPKPRS